MRRLFSFIGIVIVIMFVATGFYLYYLYDTSRELSNHIYDPLPIIHQAYTDSELMNNPVQQKIEQLDEQQVMKHQPFTILIMGVDRRSGDKGRSDVLMAATVNPNDQSTRMMNIPRDTRTTIIGPDIEDKVNHAYAYGGAAMTIATVEHLLGIPIDYYIQVDMEGFQQIIDTLGGIEVNNTLDFQYEGHKFPLGPLALEGNEALAYVRMRYDDPQGDLGRNERQKLVIQAVVDQLQQIQSVFKLNKIAKAIEKNVKTNLTFDEWKKVGVDYREALNHVETEMLKGHGQMIEGIYYYIVTDEEKLRITERLRLHLDG